MTLFSVENFDTLELLQESLNRNYGQFISTPQLGGMRTLKGFREWYDNYEDKQTIHHFVLLIPADPSSFLVLPTIRQEIEMSKISDDMRFSNEPTWKIANSYNFFSKQIDQPIHTLSGGERIRAALMKADLLLPNATELVLSSPSQWLDSESIDLLDRLVQRAKALEKKITVYNLKGDSWPSHKSVPQTEEYTERNKDFSLNWSIKSKDFLVKFESFDPDESGRSLFYKCSHIDSKELKSPTLLTGKNGVGKSIFAQCVAGMKIDSSKLNVVSRAGFGFGRIILQDCLNHFFRNELNGHLPRVFDFDSEGMKKATTLFRELCAASKNNLWSGNSSDGYLVGNEHNPSTIMQSKLLLTAERLMYSPPVLILDEPAWGLSLKQARVFIDTVLEESYKLGVPLLIISHDRNWLPHNIGSEIRLNRSENDVLFELL
jgi:energy-coupling factor transporter ATP-binding protein EcfA2